MLDFHKTIVICLLLFNTSAHSMEQNKIIAKGNTPTWVLWLELEQEIPKKDFYNTSNPKVDTDCTGKYANINLIKKHIDKRYNVNDHITITKLKQLFFMIETETAPKKFKIVEQIVVNGNDFHTFYSNDKVSDIAAYKFIPDTLKEYFTYKNINSINRSFVHPKCSLFLNTISRYLIEANDTHQKLLSALMKNIDKNTQLCIYTTSFTIDEAHNLNLLDLVEYMSSRGINSLIRTRAVSCIQLQQGQLFTIDDYLKDSDTSFLYQLARLENVSHDSTFAYLLELTSIYSLTKNGTWITDPMLFLFMAKRAKNAVGSLSNAKQGIDQLKQENDQLKQENELLKKTVDLLNKL